MRDSVGLGERHTAAIECWAAGEEHNTLSHTFAFAEADRVMGMPSQSAGRRRADNWVRRLDEFEMFVQEHGRLPREHTPGQEKDGYERMLAEWARYQRRHRHALCAFQRCRLEVSDAFDWDPLDAAWDTKFLECWKHLEATGVLPQLNRRHRAEFALARWLGRQLDSLQGRRLTRSRGRRIQALLDMATHLRIHQGDHRTVDQRPRSTQQNLPTL